MGNKYYVQLVFYIVKTNDKRYWNITFPVVGHKHDTILSNLFGLMICIHLYFAL